MQSRFNTQERSHPSGINGIADEDSARSPSIFQFGIQAKQIRKFKPLN